MIHTIRMRSWLAGGLLAVALGATQAASVAPSPVAPKSTAGDKSKPAAGAKASAPAGTPAAGAPGAPPGQPTVDDIYTAAGQRDPFVPVPGSSAGKSAAAAEDAGADAQEPALPAGLMHFEDFSIHTLALKGVMEDRTGGFAVLVDSKFGATFVLKRGKLYDARNKPVPGVAGVVNVKERTVRLTTPDRDSEVLSLGAHDDDQKDDGEAPDAAPGPKDKP